MVDGAARELQDEAPGRTDAPSQQVSPTWSRGELAAAMGVGVLALFDALWRLTVADWKTDEAWDGRLAWDAIHGGWAQENGHPVFVRWFLGLGQLAFGQDRLGIRITPALASLAAVWLLYLVGLRLHSRWAGLLAAGLWAVLPRALVLGHTVVGPIRGDRFGYLEPFMVVALLGATATAWRWIERDRLADALSTGALLGLAAAFKPTAVVAVVPIVAVAAWRRGSVRPLLVSAAAMGALAAAVFVVTYLPVGTQAPDHIVELFRFQFDHAKAGHALVVDGVVRAREPWTSHLLYQWRGMGPLANIGIAIGMVGAWTGRRRAEVALVTGIWGTLLATHLLTSVALPHYYLLWAPFSVLLAAMGLAEMAHRTDAVSRLAATAAGTLLVVAGLGATWQVATLRQGDYGRMAAQLQAQGVRPKIVRFQGEAVERYFPTVEQQPGIDVGQVGLSDPFVAFDVLVLDPRDTPLLPGHTLEDLRAQAEQYGLVRQRIGRLEVWSRPSGG